MGEVRTSTNGIDNVASLRALSESALSSGGPAGALSAEFVSGAADELEARREMEDEWLGAESAAGCAVCIHWSGSVCDKNCALHGGMCASLETPFCSPRVAELEAENARLREALRPFALVSREFCVLRDDEGITLEPPPARGCDDLVVCVSRFRRAAEALGGGAS